MPCKEGQTDVVELMVNNLLILFIAFSINLNAQYIDGMTPLELSINSYYLF